MAVLLLLVALAATSSSPDLPNLAQWGKVEVSSCATEIEGKYGPGKAIDGNSLTRWASCDQYSLPQWFEVRWGTPQTVDTLWVIPYVETNLYDAWREWEVSFSEGEALRGVLKPEEQELFLRFPPHSITSLRVAVRSTYTRSHYVGIAELFIAHDPQRLWNPQEWCPRPLPRDRLRSLGGLRHPTVYLTPEDVERARRNRQRYLWGEEVARRILAEAENWLKGEEKDWLKFLPGPGACYAYGITGCPICGASWGTWGSANCSWERPGMVRCAKGHSLPDEEHPDDGTGYRGPDGRLHYFVGSWNAWVTEQWTLRAIPSLARAYALTGDERYAERAAFFLDALASIYAESTSGSWDYPSRPPSGRLARPWYQVARTLVVFVEAYDLIYSSPALDKPSLRPRLEKTWPPPPWPQTKVVGTPEAHGQSWPGMTRRENIDRNLMEDAAYYCYRHTFEGLLHNGHADYLRGALAVGCLLNIPEYVRWAIEGPYSIYAMLDNNVDRDGQYHETSLVYGLHTRDLYLTFAEPLRNWRDEHHPEGLDLYREPRFRWFYALPNAVMDCAGHAPNFGDTAPDNRFALPVDPPFSLTDYVLAERVFAGSRDPATRSLFASILHFLTGGDLPRVRANLAPSNLDLGWWLLCHGEDLPAEVPPLPAWLRRRVEGSWFLGQKGLALLRTGRGERAQAALLRFGPSLNHAQLDELGLIYYAYGWQLIYEIGYGFGSAHTRTGWAHRTASHNLVVVNERNQLEAPGSGGSLHLFASVPGLQLVEASAENAYSSEKVSLYRRTVALVGGAEPSEPAYLLDIFRVVGGRQHDYFLGVQTQEYEVEGLELGAEQPGSLAGPEVNWGTKVGNDGDIVGYPNRPYWNPPPGNGYGFFYGVRPGKAKGSTWRITWPLGGPLDVHLRVHFLLPAGPKEEGEALPMMAKAPGLYPHNRSASYAIVRRRGVEPLRSAFVAVMEPYPASKAKPFLTRVERLACIRAERVQMEPAGVRVVHTNGWEDYLFSGGLRDGPKVFATPRGLMEIGGAFAWMRLDPQGKPLRVVLHGADVLRWGGREWHASTRAYEGTVQGVEMEGNRVLTSSLLPLGEPWEGRTVVFTNPAYTRTTAYRLERLEATKEGRALCLGETSFLLGRAKVLSVPDECTLIVTPHEYARSLNGQSLFFNGKQGTNGAQATTRVVAIEFGVPMVLRVESSKGFRPGDPFLYLDLQPGDKFLIPTTMVMGSP